MSKITQVTALVRSMTKSEKRYFRLMSEMTSGKKDYLILFDILESTDLEHAEEQFSVKCRHVSLDNCLKYLYKVIMRSLVMFDADKSADSRLFQYISEIKILYKKALYDDCYNHIQKAKKLALTHEKHAYYLIIARLELQYLTRTDIVKMDEQELIKRQSKIGKILKQEEYVHRHSSLYELLLFRYLNKGAVRNQKEKDELNDLVFSEMSIMSNPQYDSFEARKLHLMFQSVYFMMTGDIKSSLKIYYELNRLFENNPKLWEDPPLFYIQHISGILNSLISVNKYDEMDFFINKLLHLKTSSASAKLLVLQIVYQFKMLILIDKGLFDEAIAVTSEFEEPLLKKHQLMSPHTKAICYLYTSLAYFGNCEYRKAAKYLQEILNQGKPFNSMPSYKIVRLINLFVHLEMNNYNYLDYEIRSFERELARRQKLFTVEKLIFKFMKKLMNTYTKKEKINLYQTCKEELINLKKNNKYERQFLRIFDIVSWFNSKIKNESFANIIRTREISAGIQKMQFISEQ